jgi:phospholipid-binding lipoprotein MlaA
MRRSRSILICLGLAVASPTLAHAHGQSASPDQDPAAVDDPFEPVNRVLFKLDKGFNRLVGKHDVFGAAGFLPRKLRTPLYNFFNNLDEPANAANDLLQQKWRLGVVAGGRFATNTTVGALGTIDVASRLGLERHREDFGQTLGKYGVKPGPYLFVPISGPTSLRDAAGDQVDGFARPLHWANLPTPSGNAISLVHHIVQPHVVSIRERARRAAESGETTDEYATLRQLYFNQRRDEIADTPGASDYTLPVPPRPLRGIRPVDRRSMNQREDGAVERAEDQAGSDAQGAAKAQAGPTA